MRFYTRQHRHTCGVDLHTKNAYLCILDEQGNTVYHRNNRAQPDDFLRAIEPYRDDLVVGCECMFMWYWLADLCADEGIEFVLGHAYYMKAIHGAKAANDRLDSLRIAKLLKGGTFPIAYVYPRKWRSTRDLLRRRTKLVRQRAHLLAHLRSTHWQYLLAPPGTRTAAKRNRVDFEQRFDDPSARMSVEADLAVIDNLKQVINRLETYIQRKAKIWDAFSLQLLRSLPGIGKILSLTMLYEIHDVDRFERHQQFASYARLVRCEHTSDGKRKGFGQKKMGNVHLKWAFSEAAVLMINKCPEVKKVHQRWEQRYGTKQALSRLAHKIGRAVYYILKRQLDPSISKCSSRRPESGGETINPPPNWSRMGSADDNLGLRRGPSSPLCRVSALRLAACTDWNGDRLPLPLSSPSSPLTLDPAPHPSPSTNSMLVPLTRQASRLGVGRYEGTSPFLGRELRISPPRTAEQRSAADPQ